MIKLLTLLSQQQIPQRASDNIQRTRNEFVIVYHGKIHKRVSIVNSEQYSLPFSIRKKISPPEDEAFSTVSAASLDVRMISTCRRESCLPERFPRQIADSCILRWEDVTATFTRSTTKDSWNWGDLCKDLGRLISHLLFSSKLKENANRAWNVSTRCSLELSCHC